MNTQQRFEIPVLASVLIIVFGLMSLLAPARFLSAGNLQSMGFQLPELGLLSLAMMVTMVSGGIDLSIVATSNLAGIVTALLLRSAGVEGETTYVLALGAMAAGVGVASMVGLANGWLIGVVGVSPILATLGIMTFVGGLALVLTGGSAISGLPETIAPLGNGLFCGIPIPLWLFGTCALAVAVLLERTPWGFRLYMLGANPTASLYSGVNNRRVTLLVYALSGALSGIAGTVMISRFNSAKADYGESYLLITILAAVLGGTSPTGGFGRVAGLVLALAILQVLSSGLNILRFDAFLTIALWGATILAVMSLHRLIDYLRDAKLARPTHSGERWT